MFSQSQAITIIKFSHLKMLAEMVKKIKRRKNHMKRRIFIVEFFVIISLLLFVVGCASFGTDITANERKQIIKGKTTKIEVLRKFGNPDQTVKLDNETEEISYIKENVVIGLAPLVKPKNTEFWLQIKNGIVQDFGERETNKSPNYMK